MSPKWNISDAPTLPGNGYYGIEVGNLHEAVPVHSNRLVVSFSCYGANERLVKRVNLQDITLEHQQHDAKLELGQFPDFPSVFQVNRENGRNIVDWSGKPDLTYSLYRTTLTDTLWDGRPKRVYQRIAKALTTQTYKDDSIDPAQWYGYITIAEDKSGRQGGHSPEMVDVPINGHPITQVSPFSDGSVAVTYGQTDGIVIIDEHGEEIATLPTDLRDVMVVDSSNRLWVAKDGWEGINLYSSTGKMIESFPWGEELAAKEKIIDLSIDQHNRLWVLTENSLSVFGRTLHIQATLHFDEQITSPTSISLMHDQIAVAYPVEHEVKLYRFSRGKIRVEGTIFMKHSEPWGIQWLNAGELAASDPFQRTITVYDTNGNRVGLLEQDVLGSFVSPRVIRRQGDDLYIVDGHRVVVLPAKFPTPTFTPAVSFTEVGKATITWKSLQKTESAVRFWTKRDEKRLVANPRLMRYHNITLTDLRPITRIDYEITVPLRSIPPVRWSMPFDFATPLWESGKTAILRLPLAVILHTHAVDLEKQPEGHPPTTPISTEEVDRIRKEIAAAVLFYWHNSRMKLFLDVDFFTNDKFLDVAPFGEHSKPDPDRVDAFLSSHGHHLFDYVGIVRIIAEQEYDEDAGTWVLSGRGGGFTIGINPTDNLPGASWWRATPAVESSGNNWLFVHEFHHQLDAMFQESGHPEYPFNHFSPMEYTGPFGEHYDGNAYILKHGWSQNNWFLSRWGDKLVVDDQDGDGIPDNASLLPSDEKRLGSRPDKKDSDNDNLDDLEEIMLSNWVMRGVGEDWGGPINLPDLVNPDADGDGLNDGEDPLPLYSVDPTIELCSTTIDGVIQEGEWPLTYEFQDDAGRGQIYFCWDEGFLYGAANIQPPASFHLQIDANMDGWFMGRDNLVFRFSPNPDGGEPKVDTKVFVCDTQPEKYPHMVPNLFPANLIEARNTVTEDGCWVLEFGIPKNDALGLSLRQGEQIGVNAGCYFDKSLRRRLSLFEPNRMIYLTLEE